MTLTGEYEVIRIRTGYSATLFTTYGTLIDLGSELDHRSSRLVVNRLNIGPCTAEGD